MSGDELKEILVRQAAIAELEDKLTERGLGAIAVASTVAKMMRHDYEPLQIADSLNLQLSVAERYSEALRWITESEFNLLCSLTGRDYCRR